MVGLNPDALDRYITGNYGEDQFKDSCGGCGADLGRSDSFVWHDSDEDCRAVRNPVCTYLLQDGPCQLDPDHPGRHTTVAYYCDSCGRMRRSQPVTHLVDANGDIDVDICFMCERGLTGP